MSAVLVPGFDSEAMPMLPKGFGCWRPAKPCDRLPRVRGANSLFLVVCEYVVLEGAEKLCAAGIDTGELFGLILSDKEFEARHPLEGKLAELLSR